MANLVLKKAKRDEVRLRMLIGGPTKAGKTITMLRFLQAIAPGKYGVIDSEHGRVKLYVNDVNPDGGVFEEFNLIELSGDHAPTTYGEALTMMEEAGVEACGIDSMSHEWKAILESVDKLKAGGEKYLQPWAKATPTHEAFIARILKSPMHIIGTMRSKMEYVLEQKDDGKKEVVKKGLQKVGRDDSEYEFDIILDMNEAHYGRVTGARAQVLDGLVVEKPGADLANKIMLWLREGARPLAEQAREESQLWQSRCRSLADDIAAAMAAKDGKDDAAREWHGKALEHIATKCGADAAGIAFAKRTVETWKVKLAQLTAPAPTA